MNQAALLIIDMQNWFFHQERPVYREEELLTNINRLIAKFHRADRPVLFIRHANDTYLKVNTDDWELHTGIDIGNEDLIMDKRVRNTFEEPAVLAALCRLEIGKVVIAGMVTHGCIRAACEGAMAAGFSALLAADAHSSFDERAAELISEVNSILMEAGAEVADTDRISLQCSVMQGVSQQ